MSDIPQNVPWDKMGDLFKSASKTSPCKGARVTVARGKHKDKVGTVTWHGVNTFSQAGRYGSDLSNMLREAIGIHGFRVRIQPDEGDAFFTNCENLSVDKAGAIIPPEGKESGNE